MIAMFSRCIEYIMAKNSTHFTPYLIESTLELLESTGADLCTHVQYLCRDIALCSSANCSNKSADDEVLCGVTFTVLCANVRYCSLLFVIVHYFENQPKKNAELFARKKKML